MTLSERLGSRAEITKGIVAAFKALSRHPHKSWHEGDTCRDLADWLTGLGLTPVTDTAGNLMADVPAAPGREGAPLLILQGHMDMVCAVAPGSGFDPLTDPVNIVERDGFLRSDGRSSLGADNMLGNAVVLWLLSTGRVAHGPLRLLFTVAEEVGLDGAKAVDPAWLEGAKYLLNTDGFQLGRAIVGAASGRRGTYTRPLKTMPAPAGTAWRIALTGGTGGHSGYDIHRGRVNAIQALGELLNCLTERTDCALAHWEAGTAHNAIPAQGSAVMVVSPGREAALRETVEAFAHQIKQTYTADPGLTLTVEQAPLPDRVWTPPCRDDTLGLVNRLFCGVAEMHPAFPGVVGSSANVGKLGVEKDEIRVCAFLRCHDAESERALAARHDSVAQREGFNGDFSGYSAWPGEPDNPLAALLARVYRGQTGGEMEINAVHVGLEPSVLRAKRPDLVMVSTGPDILDAHSVDERSPLGTLPDYALLLAGLLEAL